MKNRFRYGTPQTGDEPHARINFGEKTSLVHSFFPCALFSSRLFISSPVPARFGPTTPKFGVLY